MFDFDLQRFAEGGEGTGEAGTPATEKATFDQLLEDQDYKAEYEKRIKDTVSRRMRGTQAKVQAAKDAEPIMQYLRNRYGVENAADIQMALEKDDAWMEEKAAEMGMSKAAYKRMNAMEQQLKRQQMDVEEQQRQQEWNAILLDADNVAAMYPGFSMDEAVSADPRFMSLVHNFATSGFPNPVQLAFEALNRQELTRQQVMAASQQTRQHMANAIASGAQRPAENGANTAPSATAIDPSKLSAQQREEIRRKVMAGEKITF